MVTARARDDIPRPPLADRINELPELNISETGSVTRLNHWVLGRDMLGSDEFMACLQRIEGEFQRQGMSSPDWRDWDHLHAHYLLRRDVFLTWDKAILAAGGELQTALGALVMAPEAYLEARGCATPSAPK